VTGCATLRDQRIGAATPIARARSSKPVAASAACRRIRRKRRMPIAIHASRSAMPAAMTTFAAVTQSIAAAAGAAGGPAGAASVGGRIAPAGAATNTIT
jgi:hypothetical protein